MAQIIERLRSWPVKVDDRKQNLPLPSFCKDLHFFRFFRNIQGIDKLSRPPDFIWYNRVSNRRGGFAKCPNKTKWAEKF